MATTKLKRTLFIGVGGTGMKTILQTKKLYKDAYGSVPDVIGFLGIDTSTEEFAKTTETKRDAKTLKLEANETVQLRISNPGAYYTSQKEKFEWLPTRNLGALKTLGVNGAGQTRTNGRFTFSINYGQVESAFRNAVNRVSNARNDGGDQWELVPDKLQIYMVFSMSGGTGSGIFINMAYLINDILGDDMYSLQACVILPNIYQNCGKYVGANAYGAMLDMDYLMSSINYNNPYEMLLFHEDRPRYYSEKPFDLVYLIDNKNRYGDVYTEASQLYSMVAQALLAISGPIGSESAAIMDNAKVVINEGSFDVEDKKAWIAGMGVCEILIDTDKLVAKYSCRASSKLVEKIVGSSNEDEIGQITRQWVDSNEIREHDADQLIDSLYDMKKVSESSINAKKSEAAEEESKAYIENELSTAIKKMAENYTPKLNKVKDSFTNKLNEIAAGPLGLTGAGQFVEKLIEALNIYHSEMDEESTKKKSQTSGLKSEINEVIADWKKAKIWTRTDFASDLRDKQEEFVRNEIEIARRDKAAQFLLTLKEYAQSFVEPISEIITRMNAVGKAFSKKATELEYKRDNANPFQIDLAGEVAIDGAIDPDCTISNFAATLPDGDLFCMKNMSSEDIEAKIDEFTLQLPGTKKCNEFEVEEVVLNKSEEDRTKLFDLALKKSQIVLEIENDGYLNPIDQNLFVGVYGGERSKLFEDKMLGEQLQSDAKAVKFASLPNKKNIIIFRQNIVYPAFQIAAIMRKEREYEKYRDEGDGKTFSFDAKLENKLDELHYGFKPGQKKDDGVLEIWVKGFIHGLIKHEGQRYEVWSPGLSGNDRTLGDWVKLKAPEEGQGTEARAAAFEDFKSKKRTLLKGKKDLYERIIEIERNMGKDQLTALYTEVQNSAMNPSEYVDKYSCANVRLETMSGLAYRKTKAVVNDEIDYVQNKLVASINK